ncbi:7892_t:CDS:2 [Funneliformis geosporum]|nr:7892_t:CDS:2 [Funneliformis geosporum]
MLSKWINMLEDESNEEDVENDESDSDSNDKELEISVANISNLPHSARDQNSKWKLQDIFIESLGEPNYLSTFILGNS